MRTSLAVSRMLLIQTWGNLSSTDLYNLLLYGNSRLLFDRKETKPHFKSIAEKCVNIWGILKMTTVKSAEPENNSFSLNDIIRYRSKLLPLGFSKFVLVLIL